MAVIAFLKREMVLTIALVCAALSAVAVPPDGEYLSYIDFRTLGILFCLMGVMAGLQKLGFFTQVAKDLLARSSGLGQMVLILVLLPFFASMLITNDVALITFVPLTLATLEMADKALKDRWMVFVVVMQTIAANLGSMLTPIGNPQNLYLYGIAGMGLSQFVLLLLPHTLLSLALLVVCVLWATRKAPRSTLLVPQGHPPRVISPQLLVYGLLFALNLLVVIHILDWRLVLGIEVAVLLLLDRGVLAKVDYSLLATFVALFIFIGNLGRVEPFYRFLSGVIAGREVLTAVVCSQVTSNVPAALLLSGFTDQVELLILGVNLGGLGTLIASMASLISFKYVAQDSPGKKGIYLARFTGYNLAFLALLMVFTLLFPL